MLALVRARPAVSQNGNPIVTSNCRGGVIVSGTKEFLPFFRSGMVAWHPSLAGIQYIGKKTAERGLLMSTQAVARGEENGRRVNIAKDNWLGFIGDVTKFTGEVHFKSMLRIDGHFTGRVSSSDGTLIVSNGAQLTGAVIEVAVARINGTVQGDIHATKELVLGCTANVSGEVIAPALTVEEGALLNANCRRQ